MPSVQLHVLKASLCVVNYD